MQRWNPRGKGLKKPTTQKIGKKKTNQRKVVGGVKKNVNIRKQKSE